MRIVVITHGGGSLYHGPNMRWYFMGKALIKLGYDVTIVSSSYFHKYTSLPAVEGAVTKEIIDDITYLWVRTAVYKNKFTQVLNQVDFSLKAYFLVGKGQDELNADVVIASSPHPMVIYAANRLANIRHVPLIYEVRDLWPLIVMELGGFGRRHPYVLLLKMAEKFAIKNASYVASVKPGDIEYFQDEYDFPASRYLYVPNGFFVQNDDSEKGPPDEGALSAAQTDRDSAYFVIGYVGAISTYYGLRELIEAAEKLSEYTDIRFRIVGGGEHFESLKRYAESLGLENIAFTGKVGKETVSREVEGFDVCYVGLKDVSPNLYGISCNKIFEYMYAAKPIVASYRSNYDVVEEAQCGITVPPNSPDLLAEAFLSLYESQDKCAAMGESGKKYFLKNHEFSNVARIYDSCFRSITRAL